ncbi:hypothetical protein M9H77_26736 [Catharanthus roseus]|uniref:Uncharacterized protein n=1 Tax=Catharanthus roseus TaxID=4058 RepID=A0ACC0AAK6_CATRO|nr:hypothetical protein M9H77_26736 [Catharanthus roseus]
MLLDRVVIKEDELPMHAIVFKKRLKGNDKGWKRSESNEKRNRQQKYITYRTREADLPLPVGAENSRHWQNRNLPRTVALALPSVISMFDLVTPETILEEVRDSIEASRHYIIRKVVWNWKRKNNIGQPIRG